MAGASLIALIDDIASILDDVSLMTKVATKKTAGVLGDDLALNAQQVAGVDPSRELPVVWAVAKGSLINKVILVPAALAISFFAPWLVVPLLMLGGAYLCFEGFEKLAHPFLHALHVDDQADDREQSHQQALHQALENPAVDLLALEQEKIRGAIRTDFILSAEIITITLGTVAMEPIGMQLMVLSIVAVLITAGVYGLVAGIVKLDDGGLFLSRRQGAHWLVRCQRACGRGVLRLAPWLMKSLSVLGTAAMFLVGGGIMVHGIPPLYRAIHDSTHAAGGWIATLGPALADGLLGILAGALLLALFTLAGQVSRKVRG